MSINTVPANFVPLRDISVTHKNHTGDLTILYFVSSDLAGYSLPHAKVTFPRETRRKIFRICPCFRVSLVSVDG